MNQREELEFLRLWIKHGIETNHIKQGKINSELKQKGLKHYVGYNPDGILYVEIWPMYVADAIDKGEL